jgi:hypothetical protein
VPFQNLNDIPQPGSLEAEAGVFCSMFDLTGSRLITGGADKTIKVSFQVNWHCQISYQIHSRCMQKLDDEMSVTMYKTVLKKYSSSKG